MVIGLSSLKEKPEFSGNDVRRPGKKLIDHGSLRRKVVFHTTLQHPIYSATHRIPDIILLFAFVVLHMSLRLMMLIFISTIACFWLISRNAYATEDRFEIVGFVRESDIHSGNGLGGAKICIDALDRCVEADTRGFFRFQSLPRGIYQVRAEYPNYTQGICSTELTDGKAWCSISLRLGGGQATTSFAKAKSHRQYELVRTAMQAFFTPEFDQRYGIPDGSTGQLSYDLNDCNDGTLYVPKNESTLLLAFADLGYRVGVWRRYFPRLGYPEEVWRPVVDKYEENALDTILRTNGRVIPGWPFDEYDDSHGYAAYAHAMNPTLDRYRRNHPEVGEIVIHRTCGDAIDSVAVRTDPPGGRTFFIPTFFHALCKAQGIDPDDPSVCDRWREPLDNTFAYVAGDYFYRIEWPNGKIQTGRLQSSDYFNNKQIIFRQN